MSKSSGIESLIHRWADGEKPCGLVQRVLAATLQGASWGYGAVIKARNLAYSSGLKKSYEVPAKVISIGNLSAGGTGKTPLVLLTARLLRDAGHRVAVVSRGFRREDASESVVVSLGEGPIVPLSQSGDEPRMLAKALPGVGVAVGSNRVDAVQLICREFGAKVIVLDDGFQHRRLKRDLDIVTWDAMRPFESQRLLPRGILREGLASLKRSDALIITRQNLTHDTPDDIISCFRVIEPDLKIFLADALPGKITSIAPDSAPDISLEDLKSRTAGAICGIGNPESFRRLLLKCGIPVVCFEHFADHYRPNISELERLVSRFKNKDVDCILTTEKDVQNLPICWKPSLPFYSVGLKTSIHGGAETYQDFINAAFSQNEIE